MLPKSQFDIVLAILTLRRKRRSRATDKKSDETDLEDVIEALNEGGFAIVPVGSIEALRNTIEQIDGRLTKNMAAAEGQA